MGVLGSSPASAPHVLSSEPQSLPHSEVRMALAPVPQGEGEPCEHILAKHPSALGVLSKSPHSVQGKSEAKRREATRPTEVGLAQAAELSVTGCEGQGADARGDRSPLPARSPLGRQGANLHRKSDTG